MDTALDLTAATRSRTPLAGGAIPWHAYAVVLGSTSIVAGVIWDISWHSTIGRDTFWTPAHMAIYLGGVVAGVSCGWVVFKATILKSPGERAASVRIWGARGPLGAWVSIWGAIAMLTSAPFDDWWHNAYGLDVEILSPPHTVLAAGILAIGIGGLLLALGAQNRLASGEERRGGLLSAYAAGVLILMAAVFLTEYSYPNLQHSALFYLASCGTYPFYLVLAARSSKLRWPATAAAATYMLIVLVMAWILPLFPAQPMLAPIYNRLAHMASPAFPLLLVVPAAGIDLLMRWTRRWRGPAWDWPLAALLGAVFFGTFLGAQWYSAEFLISPAAENWFFAGNGFYAYFNQLGDWTRTFWGTERDPFTVKAAAMALFLAVLASRAGLWCGNGLARVKR